MRKSALVVKDWEAGVRSFWVGLPIWTGHKGWPVKILDTKTGKIFHGRVRIKAVRCGKPTCKKCPHKIYAYAQFRDGKKVREKYLGIAR